MRASAGRAASARGRACGESVADFVIVEGVLTVTTAISALRDDGVGLLTDKGKQICPEVFGATDFGMDQYFRRQLPGCGHAVQGYRSGSI
jgi:hypothetical protein